MLFTANGIATVTDAVITTADYAEADADRPAFWTKQARELLTWNKDFSQAWTGAIYFEGEPSDTRTYTYAQLTDEVKRAAN